MYWLIAAISYKILSDTLMPDRVNMQQAPSPWRVYRKRHITVEDVRSLLPYVRLYSYVDLLAFDLLLFRLYYQAERQEDRLRIDRLANELLRAVRRR